MAAAAASLQDFCEEALCSICLEYLKDPVILIECGHNFCRACLTRYWEGSEGGGVSCCCPQCRRKVQRNLLIPNQQLANFVDLTRKLRLQEQNSAEGKGGVCVEHQEPLKLFCKEDEIPLCVVCKWLKQHQDHQVVPLEEAAQEYKNLISSYLGRLEKKRAEIIASKMQTEDECQLFLVMFKQTKAEVEKTRDKLKKPHTFFNKQNKRLLAQKNLKLARLEEVEEDIARNRDKGLARLSEELSSLGSLVQEMEEKRQQPPEELLQDVREILQRFEKRKTFPYPLFFSPELRMKLRDVCRENPFLHETMPLFRYMFLPGSDQDKENVTLDPKTAHPHLILSEDRKSVSYGDKSQHLPIHPARFDLHPYVLGCEGFLAGRHYWEVTVESEGDWAVGLARKLVQRKGTVSFSTAEGFWAVGRWAGKYRATGCPEPSSLPLSGTLRRIRVSLNYVGEQVAFHDADTGTLLHRYLGACFPEEALLPFFSVWENASLTISD